MTWTRPTAAGRLSRPIQAGRITCRICDRSYSWGKSYNAPDQCCSTSCLNVYHTQKAAHAQTH